MARRASLNGVTSWALHRLVANYWSLPMVAVLFAPLFALLTIWFDREGATAWLLDHSLTPIASAETAKEVVSTAVAVGAAFITLYFSITLLVLTLAAGNLGVRLVERWLDKSMVRIAMSALAFSLVYALIVLAAVDPAAPMPKLPLLSILLVIGFQVAMIGLMGVALHDLGRTMFIDTSIEIIGHNSGKTIVNVVGAPAHQGDWAMEVKAPSTGYIEGIDTDRLNERLGRSPGKLRFCVAPGAHVLKGEPILQLEREQDCEKEAIKCIAIGDYRSNGQGPVFEIRLLVEIAARALSPGINDFYTALTSVDALTDAMAGQADNWVDEGLTPHHAEISHFELPGQDFAGLFAAPLAQLRQAAADYPAVSVRMIDNYTRLIRQFRQGDAPLGLMVFLNNKAERLATHTISKAELDADRDDLMAALARCQEAFT
ncbi:DUF2254 domain-containing protein [Altererythrobacter indicus]|uniref:DUF2254 domain-containing protein n=1 Tax=Altericroceibacterium indicum TaxID=374177 RepID=A0A845A493_9SPHN|nr:DUF2254 domain-containing protein [Altericroceibacterium indicum]